MTKRQPDSTAIAEARVELAGILRDLTAIERRSLALSNRLKRAARTGEVVGAIAGKPYALENYLADVLRSTATEDGGSLHDCIAAFASLSREDYRVGARYYVEGNNGQLAGEDGRTS